ncbi:MAG: hypothetical protein HC903_21065 [Methylacidiphilales bacterium]|nr:hypothetical protein [Candidatus Methylacidiphilales bacterium]
MVKDLPNNPGYEEFLAELKQRIQQTQLPSFKLKVKSKKVKERRIFLFIFISTDTSP